MSVLTSNFIQQEIMQHHIMINQTKHLTSINSKTHDNLPWKIPWMSFLEMMEICPAWQVSSPAAAINKKVHLMLPLVSIALQTLLNQ